MSFLTPLYLAGLLTVSLPILFHFFRRAPRGVQVYSSLMFLAPSPPRLTRRSRIDHWLLLVLRGLALILIAIAFCRPLLRETSSLAWDAEPGRRVAVLVDTSASMRRGGLWEQAERQLEQTLKGLKSEDTVALFHFDRRLHVDADFASDVQPLAVEADAVRTAFKSLQPTWADTALGTALVTLSERLVSIDDREAGEQALQIVLISDLQEGARLESLQAISWPERVSVDVRQVAAATPNASVHLLERSLLESDPLAVRLRVVNSAGRRKKLELSWGDGRQQSGGETVEAPKAGSKVVRSKRPDDLAGADRVHLAGDQDDFDNVCYVLPPLPRPVHLVFWGDEGEKDPQGLRLYLENAALTAPHHEVHVHGIPGNDVAPLEQLVQADLVVLTQALPDIAMSRAREAATRGARLLMVLRDVDAEQALGKLLPDGAACQLAEADDEYALLSNIDFKHPVFAPLSSARYNDFTKVRFWKHRRLRWDEEPEQLRVLATFDDGDLAIGQWPLGWGEVTLMTSGWDPTDSRLAVSTKFVPLAAGLLDRNREDRSGRQFAVLDPVPCTALDCQAEALTITTPSGDVVELPEDAIAFTDTTTPGVYTARWGDQQRQFAVNLAADESRTAPLQEQELTEHGVRIGQAVALGQVERQRQRRRAELEGRQKLWQWLIAAAIVILILETVLAGYFARKADVLTPAAET